MTLLPEMPGAASVADLAMRPLRVPSGTLQLSASLYGTGPDGLLLLPPVGEERKGCVRPLADLARAGEGFGKKSISIASSILKGNKRG